MSDIRPTLFLAQLSTCSRQHLDRPRRHRRLAHLHGRGAVRRRRAAHRRGAHPLGQNDIFLVGGALNAEREDLLLVYELGGIIWRDPSVPVLAREGGGFVLGSASVFLVLESRDHARRGAPGPTRASRRSRPTPPADRGFGRGRAGRDGRGARPRADGGFRQRRLRRGIGRGGGGAGRQASRRAQGAVGRHDRHAVEAQFPFGVALAAAGLTPAAVGGVHRHQRRPPPGRRRGQGGGGVMAATRDSKGRPVVAVTGMGVVTSSSASARPTTGRR